MNLSVLDQLTSDQKKTVEGVGGNVCVLAGAGTGKTSVLVERFLHLISNQFAHCNEILAITFTEKAAQEMKSRIASRLKNEGLEEARRELENAYIGTIHSFCSRILKEHPIEAGVDPEFRVLQEEEANLLKESALDDLIESQFQQPDVFGLLRIYSDEKIRESIKSVCDKAHASGFTSFAEPQLSHHAKSKLKALEALEKIRGKESDCAEAMRLIERPISNWKELEEAKGIFSFFKRNKNKPEIGAFKDCLDEWIAEETGHLADSYRKTFLRLVSDFETRYTALKAERFSLDFNDLECKAFCFLNGDNPRSIACRNLYQKKFKFIMVDEFQDTSPLQNRIISLVAMPDNLFIVGDWKQSIFGFRGSDPELLIEKAKLFQKNGQVVSLTENFRSRTEILNKINSFCEAYLFSGFGFESLKAAGAYPEKENHSVEFLAIERKDDESMSEARMGEARVLAERISEMVKSGAYQYQDFAMLFRATTDIYFYEYELRNYNVPYYVVGGRGFYKQPEIRDIVSFLELFENPHLNIPLAAVLRSPFVQISDDALFWLADRSSRLDPPKPLYEALLQFEKIPELKDDDKIKLEAFRSFFFQLLNEKEKWTVSEFIERIVEHTKYDRYVLHAPQGKRHYANIRKLLELARELESREPVHLGDFIRYVKGLETQEVRESEAQVEALEGNVVKLMTIHNAKGLEFKVVVLPDLNRKSLPDRSKFLFDPEYGVGPKVLNEATNKFEETWAFQKIKERLVQNRKAESKRLLYVAMTRAKEHIIFSGASKADDQKGQEGFDDGANWFEWLREWSEQNGSVKLQSIEVPKDKAGRHFLPLAEHKRIKTALEKSQPITIKMSESLTQLIEFLRPIKPVYFERIDLPVSAYTVFKHDQEEFRNTYELGVLPEEKNKAEIRQDFKLEEWLETEAEEAGPLSAADFGTVIHKVFEHLVSQPDKARSKLKFWLERFQNLNESTFNEVKTLSEIFLKSAEFSKIQLAKKRYPEIPFVLRLHHGIIQGTLDLLYQNAAGEWIILDYKTSQILEGDLQIHADRYQGQMLLYALACHELLKLKPKTASLYFVRVDKSFSFSLADVDYQNLRHEFESLQKQILDQRKEWISK